LIWVEHIKCELIESLNDTQHFEQIIQALILLAYLELMPDEIEEELFTFIERLSVP